MPVSRPALRAANVEICAVIFSDPGIPFPDVMLCYPSRTESRPVATIAQKQPGRAGYRPSRIRWHDLDTPPVAILGSRGKT